MNWIEADVLMRKGRLLFCEDVVWRVFGNVYEAKKLGADDQEWQPATPTAYLLHTAQWKPLSEIVFLRKPTPIEAEDLLGVVLQQEGFPVSSDNLRWIMRRLRSMAPFMFAGVEREETEPCGG